MKRFYITGVSGTGKSTTGDELLKKGIPVIDIDNREHDLTHWVNNVTSEISHWQSGIGDEFFKQHSYICNKEKLSARINEYKNSDTVVVIGLADNQSEFLDLFDKVFLFQCDKEIFIKRIRNRTSHDFGKHESEQKMILGWYKGFEKEMIDKGAIPINTDKPLSEVVDEIIKNISN